MKRVKQLDKDTNRKNEEVKKAHRLERKLKCPFKGCKLELYMGPWTPKYFGGKQGVNAIKRKLKKTLEDCGVEDIDNDLMATVAMQAHIESDHKITLNKCDRIWYCDFHESSASDCRHMFADKNLAESHKQEHGFRVGSHSTAVDFIIEYKKEDFEKLRVQIREDLGLEPGEALNF